MLVDNAIVVMENIFRNLENGLTAKEAAVKGGTLSDRRNHFVSRRIKCPSYGTCRTTIPDAGKQLAALLAISPSSLLLCTTVQS